MNNIKLCSGDGKYHTDRTSPLNAVDWDDITRLVENPQNVPKEDATWLIPSSLLSRDAKNQEKKGEYLALWVDIDHAPPQISVVAGVIGGIIDGCCSEVYTSKSATKEKPKSRGIIPLDKLLTPTEWLACQEILNDKLKDVGITPDRHNERLNQIFYLPNKGEYYDRQSNRGGPFFDPLAAFSEELTAMQETKELAKAKRANTALDFNARSNCWQKWRDFWNKRRSSFDSQIDCACYVSIHDLDYL